MKHDSSFNKQLKNEITAKAVMNENIRMLQVDIDKKMKK